MKIAWLDQFLCSLECSESEKSCLLHISGASYTAKFADDVRELVLCIFRWCNLMNDLQLGPGSIMDYLDIIIDIHGCLQHYLSSGPFLR